MAYRGWLVTLFFLLSTMPANAENWPVWRGPRGDGTVIDTGFPLKWSATENVTWKTEIPGRGHSSPVVWEDRVFLTSCIEGTDPKDKATPRERVLFCVDRKDGNILWRKTVLSAALERIHPENSYSSSTPATDGKLVYVAFFDKPKVFVVAYDFDGKEVWRKNPGEFESVHGFGIPPILYKNLVIVNCDQDAEKRTKPAYIVALDKSTGEEKWRIDRPNRIRSYTPPLIVEAAGKMQMVLTGCKCVASYDPNTGRQIWLINGPTEQFVASMIFHKGLFFLTAGYPTYHVWAIKPDGTGNVTETHVLWKEVKGAGYVPSPVASGDNIFLVHDDGRGSCRDVTTGQLHWFERVGGHTHSSPVLADGRIYYTDDSGATQVVKADSTFTPLEKNSIGEECFSSLAFSRGQIFIRGKKHLFCIGKDSGK
jgi:outer membrane protein assembly factor BamB